MPTIKTLHQLSQAISEFISTNYPGRAAIRVQIQLSTGRPFCADVVTPAPAKRRDVRDDLSQLERRVYDVLRPDRGLTVAAISAKLDDYDQSTLHRKALKPLLSKGLVIHDEDAGGYILVEED